MDFDANATSVKKGYGDYLKTLEIELHRGSQRQSQQQHFNRKRSQSKRSGGGGGGGHQRNLTGNFQPLNITPVNNDELYAPFSLLKQTVNNLAAYGLRPRSKAPLNMYGTTVATSTNSTIDGRP